MRCPNCKEPVAVDAPSRPFCSARCKDIDLGRWLNEEYVIRRPARIDEIVDPGEDRAEGPDPWIHRNGS